MITIEIIAGYEQVISKVFSKDGVSNERFSQFAYADLGGVFPEKIRIPLNSRSDGLRVGKYVILASAFKVNQYDDLEIKSYTLFDNIIPLSEFKK